MCMYLGGLGRRTSDFVHVSWLRLLYSRAGSAIPVCGEEPINLGLWIDALNFIVISLQIIIFDTQYAEVVKDELTRKVNEAQS